MQWSRTKMVTRNVTVRTLLQPENANAAIFPIPLELRPKVYWTLTFNQTVTNCAPIKQRLHLCRLRFLNCYCIDCIRRCFNLNHSRINFGTTVERRGHGLDPRHTLWLTRCWFTLTLWAWRWAYGRDCKPESKLYFEFNFILPLALSYR